MRYSIIFTEITRKFNSVINIIQTRCKCLPEAGCVSPWSKAKIQFTSSNHTAALTTFLGQDSICTTVSFSKFLKIYGVKKL